MFALESSSQDLYEIRDPPRWPGPLPAFPFQPRGERSARQGLGSIPEDRANLRCGTGTDVARGLSR